MSKESFIECLKNGDSLSICRQAHLDNDEDASKWTPYQIREYIKKKYPEFNDWEDYV